MAACVGALALLNACAYRLGPLNGEPAGARSVEFRPFVNHSAEPRVTEYVSEALRKHLQIDGTYRLETGGRGDIVVSGEILRMNRSELSFQATDVLTPQDYTLVLYARITAIDTTTGKTNINRRTVSGRTVVSVGNDLSSAERQAMPMLADDLARNAVALLADRPW
jgi:hypothetical protein